MNIRIQEVDRNIVPGSLAMFGYSDKTTEHELQCVIRVNKDAIIVDTRYQPACSWSLLWTRSGLEERYGDRYISRGDWLGNVNYNNSGPIQLANEKAGIGWLIGRLEEGKTLILLCSCKHEGRSDGEPLCHRRSIYERVKEILGERFLEFSSGQRVLTPKGPGYIYEHTPINVHRARKRYGVIQDVPRVNGMQFFFPHELQPETIVQREGERHGNGTSSKHQATLGLAHLPS